MSAIGIDLGFVWNDFTNSQSLGLLILLFRFVEQLIAVLVWQTDRVEIIAKFVLSSFFRFNDSHN